MPSPGTRREPQFGHTGSKGQSRRAKQTSRSDPGAHERGNQHVHRDAASRHHEIIGRLDRAALVHTDAKQHQYIGNNDNDIGHLRPLLRVRLRSFSRSRRPYLCFWFAGWSDVSTARSKVAQQSLHSAVSRMGIGVSIWLECPSSHDLCSRRPSPRHIRIRNRRGP